MSEASIRNKYDVREIGYELTKDFILNLHYARRMPSVSWAYGLFHQKKLVGVLTIGKPASNSLCKGLLGDEYSSIVYELNRLITIDGLEKNVLSYFVSRALKHMKDKNLALVSYADTGMHHTGYIYQATNWIYTGKTKERTDKYTPPNKHSRHYDDSNNHLRKIRTSKHRYVFFTQNKQLIKKLKYEIKEYPKDENRNYKLGERMKTKVYDTLSNQYYYE